MAARHRLGVIAGDGIGPEVIGQALRVLAAIEATSDVSFELREFDLGAERYLRDGVSLPDDVFEELRDGCDAILLGALGDPRVPGQEHARDILLGLRQRLDLFANVRPLRCADPRLSPLRDAGAHPVDLVIFRENTEGAYVGRGRREAVGTTHEAGVTEDVNTYARVQRILQAAFAHADRVGAGLVHMADKANAMPLSHLLWRRVLAEVASEYPHIEAKAVYIDALCLELVQAPERFQVIVTNNLFGDILSDLGAALIGGLGMAASMNLGAQRPGLFEPVHGSAPDLAGRGVANPIGAVLSAALMLEQLGHPTEAQRVQAAVEAALVAGVGTPDIGGGATTAQLGDWLVAALQP